MSIKYNIIYFSYWNKEFIQFLLVYGADRYTTKIEKKQII